MPPIPKSLEPKSPKRKRAAPPPSREALLRSALVTLLRKLGLVSHVIPTDLSLLGLAKDFSEGGTGLADDRGGAVGVKPFDLAAWQSTLPTDGPDERDIPF